MATEITPAAITADDLAAMPNRKEYELVDGRLEKLAMGNEASLVGSRLAARLMTFVDAHRLGWVFTFEAGFELRPRTVRKPDVAFVRFGRLPNERPAAGYDTLAPDLAVEVISPRDIAAQLEAKLDDYLAAGVRLVWVIDPNQQTVRVHRPDGTGVFLRSHDILSGEDVLPGFTCPVADLFAFPQPPQADRS